MIIITLRNYTHVNNWNKKKKKKLIGLYCEIFFFKKFVIVNKKQIVQNIDSCSFY